jgi:hypothetical protein
MIFRKSHRIYGKSSSLSERSLEVLERRLSLDQAGNNRETIEVALEVTELARRKRG